MQTQLDDLQTLAESSGFEVVREYPVMVIRRSGFGYQFNTNVSSDVLDDMIEKAKAFMLRIEARENEKHRL